MDQSMTNLKTDDGDDGDDDDEEEEEEEKLFVELYRIREKIETRENLLTCIFSTEQELI